MFQVKGKAEDLCMKILKPPKNDYHISDLGISLFLTKGAPFFMNDGVEVTGHEIEIASAAGLFIQSSFFDTNDEERRKTCVVYLHSISGSRLEGLAAMREVTKMGYSFMCFDFPGCGNSEGSILTLGLREKEDLRQVIKYLRVSQNITSAFLWGRSMGAVTALLYSCKYNDVAGVIADSPFSNLKKLILEMCQHYVGLPEFILKLFRNYLTSIIEEKISIDINDLDIVKQIPKLRVPVLYAASKDDELVSIEHSRKLFERTFSNKRLLEINGSHNSIRQTSSIHQMAVILSNMIQNGSTKETSAETESVVTQTSTMDSLNQRRSGDTSTEGKSRAREIVEGRHKLSYPPDSIKKTTNPYKTTAFSPDNRKRFAQPFEENLNNTPNINLRSNNKDRTYNYNLSPNGDFSSLTSFHSSNIKDNRKITYDFERNDAYKTLRTRAFTNENAEKQGDNALSTIKGISRIARKSNNQL